MEPLVLKMAHRGASGYEPENTLIAFKKALELGADGIEFDVRICKSGEPVVLHDAQVGRTTNGVGQVENLTLTELKKLDAGKGEKIPTLQEVLDLVDKKAVMNIELKGPQTAPIVAEVIKEYVDQKGWRLGDFLVSSFDHHQLAEIKKLIPELKIAPLIRCKPIDYAALAKKLNGYSINVHHEMIDKKFIDDAHNREIKIFAYTVDNPHEIKQLKKLGVDGIFSNYPDRL